MRVHQKVPSFTCARATTASLGAGASLIPASDRVVTGFVSDIALIRLQVNKVGATFVDMEDPAHATYDSQINLGIWFGIACDGTNVRIYNGTAGAGDLAYFYWTWT